MDSSRRTLLKAAAAVPVALTASAMVLTSEASAAPASACAPGIAQTEVHVNAMGIATSEYTPPMTQTVATFNILSLATFDTAGQAQTPKLVESRMTGTITAACNGAVQGFDLSLKLKWDDDSQSTATITELNANHTNGSCTGQYTGVLQNGHFAGATATRISVRKATQSDACASDVPIATAEGTDNIQVFTVT